MSASDAEFAKPFIQATIHVLSSMAGMTPTVGSPYVKSSNTALGDVSAMVGITGDKRGSFSITFTKGCAIAVVRGMLGEDIEDIIKDTKDAVGEIANMVSGQARAKLASELSMSFQGSTPMVILGDGHTLSHVTSNPVIAIPFTTEFGEFTLEFSFKD